MIDARRMLKQARDAWKAGDLPRAVELLQEILREEPENADAHHAMAMAYYDRRDGASALRHAQAAVAGEPEQPLFQNGLGMILEAIGRRAEALEAYRKAFKLEPADTRFGTRLVRLLMFVGEYGEAFESHRLMLQLNPESAEVIALGVALLRDMGGVTESVAFARAAVKNNIADHAVLQALAVSLNYAGDATPSDMLETARAYGRVIAEQAGGLVSFAQPLEQRRPIDRSPDRRLSIGYLSPDFRRHSVAYFAENILAHHDHKEWAVYAYSTGPGHDHIAQRFQRLSPNWRDVQWMNDDDLAGLIAIDRIDILVDLAGHTYGGRPRLFAGRAAPIQVSFIGYPATTGIEAMDYRLVDSITDPEDDPANHDEACVERLVRLPGCFLCYRPEDHAPNPTPPPSASGAPIVFGSFNHAAKLSSDAVKLWSEIVGAVPGSKLVLKAGAYGENLVRGAVLSRFQAAGLDPARVELLGQVSSTSHHLSQYNQVDIGLDPFPYNGTTTTLEAMWMGVPVVTLEGSLHAGRVGASLLRTIGVPELVARSPEEYRRIAVELAGDAKRLASLRAALRPMMRGSTLCDGPTYVRALEGVYRQLWRRYCDGAGGDR